VQKEYKTVLEFGTAEIEEKKSRFIASVMPVDAEEKATTFIAKLKTQYWDASHNVYSYYVCGNDIVQRYSDDREPSGTAGMPILEVIKKMGVQDLVVVVTRYFGGTLLGASGLIRAYSKGSKLGIEAAKIIRKQLCTEVNVTVEYTLFGKIQSLLINDGYTIKNVKYGQDVEMELYIPVDGVDEFKCLIIEATSARFLFETGKNAYITLGEDGKLIL
jgi:uncharacterized YigZ family protein